MIRKKISLFRCHVFCFLKSLSAISFMILIIFLVGESGLWSADQVNTSNAQKVRLLQKKNDVLKRRGQLVNEISNLQQKIDRIQRVRKAASRSVKEIEKKLSKLNKDILKLSQKIARLTPPGELAKAWKKYSDAKGRDKLEAFKALFRLARGREPNNSELSRVNTEAMQIHLELLNKTTVPLGQALIAIGDIVVKFVEFTQTVTGLTKTALNSFESLPKEAGLEITKQALDILGEDNRLAVGKKIFDNAAKKMVDDSYKASKIAFYGTEKPKELRRKLQIHLKALKSGRKKISLVVARINRAIALLDNSIKKLNSSLYVLRAELVSLDDEVSDIDSKIEDIDLRQQDIALSKLIAACKGKSVITEIGIDGPNRVTLAADRITAKVLRLPRWCKYRLKVGIGEYRPYRCTYSQYSKKTKRDIKKSVRLYDLNNLGSVFCNKKGNVRIRGNAVTVDSQRGIIKGVNPGRAIVTATADCVKVKLVESGHPAPCSYTTKLQKKTCKSGHKIICQVKKIVGIKVVKVEGLMKFQPANIIHLFPHTLMDSVQLGVLLFVKNGSGTVKQVRISSSSVHWRFTKGGGHFNLNALYGEITAVSPGEAILIAELIDKTGRVWFSSAPIQLTSTIVKGVIVQTPINFPYHRYNALPIGERAKYKIIAEGPSGKDLFVRWYPAYSKRPENVRYSRHTNFIRKGADLWVSENKITFSSKMFVGKESRAMKRPGIVPSAGLIKASLFILKADVVNKKTKKRISTFGCPGISPVLPRITRIEIVKYGSGVVPITGMDIFVPSAPIKLGRLALRLYFKTGHIAIMPIGISEIKKIGCPGNFFIFNNGKVMLGSKIKGTNYQPSSQMGMGAVYAVMSYNIAIHKHLILAKNMLKDSLSIRFHRLIVNRVGKDKGLKYRLTVLGPSELSGYTARWYMSDGKKEMTLLKRGPGGPISDIKANDRYVKKVELLNSQGKRVAQYIPARDGSIIGPPKILIWLAHLNDVFPGSSILINAQLSNLEPFLDTLKKIGMGGAKDFICTWDVDPTYGSFNPVESNISPTFIWGNSSSTLKVKNNRTLIGKQFSVKAYLWRKVGGKRIKVASANLNIIIKNPSIPKPTRLMTPLHPKRKIVNVQLIRVVNIRGNNPLNQRQPVYNRNGVTYSSLDEMEGTQGGQTQAQQGQPNQPQPPGPVFNASGCIGTFDFGMDPVTEQSIISINLAADGTSCQVRQNLTGITMGLRSPPSTPPHNGDEDWIEVMPGGVWQFDPPAAKYTIHWGTQQTFRMKSSTGLTVDITLTPVKNLELGTAQLTIHSITKVR